MQFAGVPWLQPHLAGMVRELLGALELRIRYRRALRMPEHRPTQAARDAGRSGDLDVMVGSDRERATLERMQCRSWRCWRATPST